MCTETEGECENGFFKIDTYFSYFTCLCFEQIRIRETFIDVCVERLTVVFYAYMKYLPVIYPNETRKNIFRKCLPSNSIRTGSAAQYYFTLGINPDEIQQLILLIKQSFNLWARGQMITFSSFNHFCLFISCVFFRFPYLL
jgi:hypothetical protein